MPIALPVGSMKDEDGEEKNQMFDLVLIIVTIIFFCLSWLYVKGCDRI